MLRRKGGRGGGNISEVRRRREQLEGPIPGGGYLHIRDDGSSEYHTPYDDIRMDPYYKRMRRNRGGWTTATRYNG